MLFREMVLSLWPTTTLPHVRVRLPLVSRRRSIHSDLINTAWDTVRHAVSKQVVYAHLVAKGHQEREWNPSEAE